MKIANVPTAAAPEARNAESNLLDLIDVSCKLVIAIVSVLVRDVGTSRRIELKCLERESMLLLTYSCTGAIQRDLGCPGSY